MACLPSKAGSACGQPSRPGQLSRRCSRQWAANSHAQRREEEEEDGERRRGHESPPSMSLGCLLSLPSGARPSARCPRQSATCCLGSARRAATAGSAGAHRNNRILSAG
ncbi:unnamed protein product [Prorocentrum cordatum]|uniref:Uncharacterized protein n=1 Tax=Prorocentrum cordatum TaxID=2364126 RepID=A0ABN9V4Q4_9DINO|nr:unnamed protein product [Polarella glacialis]